MQDISNKKKKFIKRNFKQLSVEELTRQTGLKQSAVRAVIGQIDARQTKAVHESPQDSSPAMRSLSNRTKYVLALASLVIFMLTVSIYIPVLNNGFVWDDKNYITENTLIRSLDADALNKMVTSFSVGNWHPLMTLSHAIDYAFWKLDPFGYHLTNIILHGLNTVLLFFLVIQLVLNATAKYALSPESGTILSRSKQHLFVAGITALLFGIHPLHVESVAWIAERKDLLCAFFVFISLMCYLEYAATTAQWRRFVCFAACFLFFALALMSKPMAVTLPIILCLIDVYPLKRFSFTAGLRGRQLPVVLEKIPFFLASVATGVVTVIAQHAGGAVESFESLSLGVRLLNALHSIMFYLQKMVWPLDLVPFYPFSTDISLANAPYLLSVILVIALTSACFFAVRAGKYVCGAAWSYYLITLLPVLGIIQVGGQAAADRYTYLPSIGIFLLAGAGLVWCWEKVSPTRFKALLKSLLLVCVCVVVSLLSYLTINQNRRWKNSETLWSHVIVTLPKPPSVAHIHLGAVYFKQGRLDEAMAEYKKALAMNPARASSAGTYLNLGNVYRKKGDVDAAIFAYEKAAILDPYNASAFYNLGNAYNEIGKLDDAILKFQNALAVNPGHANAHTNLGNVFRKKGMMDEAVAEYKKAIALNPFHVTAHYNLGIAYDKKGMPDAALSEYKNAIKLNNNYANAHYELAKLYFRKGNYAQAIAHADKARELGHRVSSGFFKKLQPYR